MEAITLIKMSEPVSPARESGTYAPASQKTEFFNRGNPQKLQAGDPPPSRIQADEETVKRIAEAMDNYVRSIQSDLEIKIHQETGTVLVKVVSHETGEVIREIPPEALIELAEKMEEMTGVLFQKKV